MKGVPDLKTVKDSSLIHFRSLTCAEEEEQDSQGYTLDPTNPVTCLSDVMDSVRWRYKHTSPECQHGGPGSTVDFWRMSNYSRGCNDGSVRGYPLLQLACIVELFKIRFADSSWRVQEQWSSHLTDDFQWGMKPSRLFESMAFIWAS